MTSATTTPASGARRRHAEAHSSGVVLSAAILPLILSCFRNLAAAFPAVFTPSRPRPTLVG